MRKPIEQWSQNEIEEALSCLYEIQGRTKDYFHVFDNKSTINISIQDEIDRFENELDRREEEENN